jgi:hypothetical protein
MILVVEAFSGKTVQMDTSKKGVADPYPSVAWC